LAHAVAAVAGDAGAARATLGIVRNDRIVFQLDRAGEATANVQSGTQPVAAVAAVADEATQAAVAAGAPEGGVATHRGAVHRDGATVHEQAAAKGAAAGAAVVAHVVVIGAGTNPGPFASALATLAAQDLVAVHDTAGQRGRAVGHVQPAAEGAAAGAADGKADAAAFAA